jgi:hypothetical protein
MAKKTKSTKKKGAPKKTKKTTRAPKPATAAAAASEPARCDCSALPEPHVHGPSGPEPLK